MALSHWQGVGVLFYPLNLAIWCHNWLVFGTSIFGKIFFSFFLWEHRESKEFTVHSNIFCPRTGYSHFWQILSLPFMWLIWNIYVSLTFSIVQKLNFRMQEIALLVQKVTKYHQLSITSRGLSGLWISCAALKGNPLFSKTSAELSLHFFPVLRSHASDPEVNSAQNIFPKLNFHISSVSCTFVLLSYSTLHCLGQSKTDYSTNFRAIWVTSSPLHNIRRTLQAFRKKDGYNRLEGHEHNYLCQINSILKSTEVLLGSQWVVIWL